MSLKKIFIMALGVICLVCLLVSCGDASSEESTDYIGISTEPSGENNVPSGEHVHSYAETVIKEATCSSAGRKAMQCACGAIEEGSEMLIPLTAHNAKDATCTEDSVCADCGKLLVEKYGHFIIDSIVTEATCTTDGLAKSQCHRCGLLQETVIPMQHDPDDTKLIVANGNVGSRCVKCGEVSGFSEQEPLIHLQFENANEASKYSDFTFTYPPIEGGAAHPGKAIWVGYNVDAVKSLPKYMVTFDFKLTADGLEGKGESIFSFIGGVTYKSEKPGTKQDWGWAFKYFETQGIVATVLNGFDSSNSIKVEKGVWNNFVGIVDNTTRELRVYINGNYIGSRTIHDYNDPAYGGAYCMRFYDAVPVNGTSDPMYDNFKIVEIK